MIIIDRLLICRYDRTDIEKVLPQIIFLKSYFNIYVISRVHAAVKPLNTGLHPYYAAGLLEKTRTYHITYITKKKKRPRSREVSLYRTWKIKYDINNNTIIILACCVAHAITSRTPAMRNEPWRLGVMTAVTRSGHKYIVYV